MVDKILDLARAQLGTVEYPPSSNNVKYNTAYYGGAVKGSQFAWCAVFIWWLFREVGAATLYFDGERTAHVPTLMDWAEKRGLIVDTPKPGDLICFEFNGNKSPDHVGICESFDGTYVTTIDGNTGVGNEANGGAVMRRKRHKSTILKIIRPRYEEVDNDMTDEKFDELMGRWLARQAEKKPEAQWQKDGLKTVLEAEVTDGSRPMAFCTRLEAAMMAAKAKEW